MQGNILGSRYRVIEYIAEGGFGKTFLAEDTQLPAKNKCVVKQLFPSVDDPNFIQIARRLFKTEAETLNTLGVHNQIPRLMAYFEEDEKFYLVQQYIEGHTLSKELVSGAAWSEAKVIELLQDCLGILNFIHNKSVIHRDVKPDNLIRRQSDNKLVLVDFGTVKAVIAEQTQLVPSTVAVGTRGYMPTEQARGKP
ncbi:MAG: serine/threonine-protein kinase, partial [Cyanobacteria bacterium J06631_2]